MNIELDLPTPLTALLDALTDAGFVAYLVGGAVRDAIMGRSPKDHDVATDALPERVVSVVRSLGWHADEIGRAFGVIKARQPASGWECEVATFRADVGTGRRPGAVRFSTIEEDVARRDLTINALFYDHRARRVIDLVGGVADVQNRRVRTVGEPLARFNEDRLRVLRAARFASTLGFDYDPSLFSAIRDCGSLEGVSPERIHDEVKRAFDHAVDTSVTGRHFAELGLWERVLPGMPIRNPERGLAKVRSFCSVVAAVLRYADMGDVIDGLSDLRYPLAEVRRIQCLVALERVNRESAPTLKRLCTAAGLSREELSAHAAMLNLTRADVHAFLSYVAKPTIAARPSMDAGYSGAALGRELNRLERELFDAQQR